MGGTGNTGLDQPGFSSPAGGGSAATPGWVAPATATPAATPAPLRPYEEVSPSTGLLAPGSTSTPSTTTPSTGTLAANPTGFTHADFPTHAAPVTTYAAPTAPVVAETPKEFAAPTSFANPWDAGIAAQQALQAKYGDWSRGWSSNPEQAGQWLQAFADAGGDYRKTDKYYNPVSLPAGQKVYWPGDPARPK